MVSLKLAKPFTLSDYAYAHRGLWHPEGPSENSLEAFMLAAENDVGIEFDVRPSADGVPIIFHDKTLDRMTDQTGDVENMLAKDLIDMPLIGGGQIVALSSLLNAWSSDAPLLCEMKIDGSTNPETFAHSVGSQLAVFSKPAAMMSFSPIAVDNAPRGIMRGQLVDASSRTGLAAFEIALKQAHSRGCDYVACHISDAKRIKTALPTCVWTVRDPETSQDVKSDIAAQIFEGFDPSLVKPARRNK